MCENLDACAAAAAAACSRMMMHFSKEIDAVRIYGNRQTANRFYSSTACVELFQTVEVLIPCRPRLSKFKKSKTKTVKNRSKTLKKPMFSEKF
jgi:hypothetical protein